MAIYSKLAEFYDALVEDPEATLKWVHFVSDNIAGKKILELACGSGSITKALGEAGYDILATDISPEMLDLAKEKAAGLPIDFRIMDMTKLEITDQYNAVICFCDSINYLEKYEDLDKLFKESYQALAEKGVLLFDMHHENRLGEFKEGWDEQGHIGTTDYQWLIESEDNQIVQYFNFVNDNRVYQEVHVQTVFAVDRVIEMLKRIGFSVEVLNDYNIFNEDLKERYFLKATK